jgi:TatD DNase family protein
MQLIDTHTHLYLPEFDPDRDEVVKRAVSNDVVRLLMPNIDAHSVDAMLAAENRYTGICHSMIGLHPTSVKEDYIQQLIELEKTIHHHKFIAIGEIGIDLYWEKRYISEQINAFRKQIAMAISLNLPVVIHSREAFKEIFTVLAEFKGARLKGVFHAFSGDNVIAEKAISMGFMLGIGGIVTFKNSGLDKVVKSAGIENLVLETDSPYLAPTPHRGKRNESSYICIINRKLADIFNLETDAVAATTFRNTIQLFNLE